MFLFLHDEIIVLDMGDFIDSGSLSCLNRKYIMLKRSLSCLGVDLE
jgi:hypothetical protein